MASIQATKDTIWLRMFMGEVGYKQAKPILIFIDFQGSLTLLKIFVHHSHTNITRNSVFCNQSLCN